MEGIGRTFHRHSNEMTRIAVAIVYAVVLYYVSPLVMLGALMLWSGWKGE